MHNKPLTLILALTFILSLSTIDATDLRGRVDGFNPYTNMRGPLPGVGIVLFTVLPNGQFAPVRQSVTGPDGMYYLIGIFPGQYVLQVGGVNYPLGVAAMQLQDIPIIQR
jgi:hypothetical protein